MLLGYQCLSLGASSGACRQNAFFHREHLTSGKALVAWDQLLDIARSGPTYLQRPEIATLVSDQLHELAASGRCALGAYVVMPNHVHVLWTPNVGLADLMRQIKGPTARYANKFLGRTGESFWQEEYFDRLVRNDAEYAHIRRYIEWNPVKVGLVHHPAEFAWSSATEKAGLKPHAS